MLRMMSPYPARPGTDTSSAARILRLRSTFDGPPVKGVRYMRDRGLEEPVPDSMEQDIDVISPSGDTSRPQPAEQPFEADEADVAEQAREFELGDDDYR
jgi:hypothetical protein